MLRLLPAPNDGGRRAAGQQVDFDTIRYPNGIPRLLDGSGKPFPIDPATGRVKITDGRPEASGLSIPHAATFIARVGSPWNTYLHDRFDEALRHAREDAEVMRRDAYLMALVDERKRSVAGLPWHLEVPDDSDAYQRRVKDGMTQILRGIPLLQHIIYWQLEALWHGRTAVQVQWEWGHFIDRPTEAGMDDEGAGQSPASLLGTAKPKKPKGVKRRCLTVRQAWPFNGDKIGFQYDGTPYILVAGDQADQIPDGDPIVTTIARAMALRGPWRERFLIHRHLREDADYFAPEQAGAIHGVGIRSKLFWLNWLKLEWMSNITDFFDRVGLGLLIWRYPAGNEAARKEAAQAASNQSDRSHILVPVWGADGREALTGIERVEVPTSGPEALAKMIDYIDRQLERYVIGQSGSAQSQGGGIGNEAATDFMASTKAAITSFDANNLAVTMTGTATDPGLCSIIKRYTFPDADFPVVFRFGLDKPESEKKLQAGKTLVDMGVKIGEEEFRSAGGYEKPAAADTLVQPPQQPGMGGPMGGMPGMPGMPGAPPGVPGAEGQPPAGGEGEPPAGGEDQPVEETGDFLDALRMFRGGTPYKYAKPPVATAGDVQIGPNARWQNRGIVRISQTGLPLYRWYDPQTRQSRVQNVPPGGRRHGVRVRKKPPGGVSAASGTLDVGSVTKKKVAMALRLMFPGGWVRPAGLPALAGLEAGSFVPADVSRDEDGALNIDLRAPGGVYQLSLKHDGVLAMTLPSPDKLGRAGPALEAAGVDVAFCGAEAVNLAERADESLPEEIHQGNTERRIYRLENADELMAEAEAVEPWPESEEGGAEETGGEPAAPAVEPSKFAAIAEVVRHLHDTDRPEAALRTAVAYAKMLAGKQGGVA